MDAILALVLFACIGAFAGFFAGLFGISGGVVIVPSLIYTLKFIDFPQAYLAHTALGTSLASVVIAASIAMYLHHRKEAVLWDVFIAMLPGLILGSLLGAFATQFLSSVVLEMIFAFFLIILAVHFFRPFTFKRHTPVKPKKSTLTWLGLLISSTASILGLGGGVFTVPMLIGLGYQEKKAIGSAAAIGLVVSFLSAIGYLYYGMKHVALAESIGYIYLPAFILIGISMIFTAPLGVKLAHTLDGNKLRKFFGGFLLLVAIVMLI
ncbi:MAG: sulfite exporter TauE/SafE family protein [Chlamydiae bacterium]|nr:sulfite exporter TauE/SafE family protein [Chlamydiota bacterium]